MMNEEIAPTATFESKLHGNDSNKKYENGFLLDALALLLLCVALFAGRDSWNNWFSSRDEVICSICILMGVFIAVSRSSWHGEQTKLRTTLTWSFLGFATLLIGIGTALSIPQSIWIAVATIPVGWSVGRIRGETVLRSMSFGLALLAPIAIDWLASLGCFEWLESATVTTTSLLADAVFLANAQSEGTVLFNRGIADQFTCIGIWDGVLSLLGASLFCLLVFRRCLLNSGVSILISAFVWSGVRSVAIVVMVCLANRNEIWYQWTFAVQLFFFLIGIFAIISLDQFFGAIFTPIPIENFDPESPLIAFFWNWLCGLPNFVLRIPEQHKIALRWRTWVKIAGKTPSLATDFDWIKMELLPLIFSPLNALGSVMDALRGWKANTVWHKFLFNSPTFLLLASIYLTMAFVSVKSTDRLRQFITEESHKLCSTEDLESASEQEYESAFMKIVGAKTEPAKKTVAAISDSKKRQLEIQCKKILSNATNNHVAKYRLGLVYALSGNTEAAFREMNEIANDSVVRFPQADAWLARALTSLKAEGKDIPMQELIDRLDNARKWKNVDFRLPSYYSRLLEEQGDGLKAVHILKEAVASNPQFILELARLYSRLHNDEGRKRTGNQAEEYFTAKTFEVESESNYLNIAEARMMSDRLEEAVEILSDCLRKNVGGVRTKRQLSEVQLLIYWKSIQQTAEGKLSVDISLLQKAAVTDPSNPSLSSEISKLNSFGLKPPQSLMQVLRNQLDLGITNVESLLLISDGLYSKKDLRGAQKYLELAVAKEPENPVVLNNLATCLVEISTDNANRSLELAGKANALSPDNATYLDTWGEILMIANRPKEAINKFERAVRIDYERINTRRKLVAAYKANGMDSMANAQSKAIQDIEKAKAKEQIKTSEDPNEKTP